MPPKKKAKARGKTGANRAPTSDVARLQALAEEDPTRAIQTQVQYYFSDGNLMRDRFLQEQMDESGYVPLSTLCKFNRMKLLGCEEPDALAVALVDAPKLELSHDRTRVRRAVVTASPGEVVVEGPKYVLVLVGLPGSGKSTVCAQLLASSDLWSIVSQDDLGSVDACLMVMRSALAAGRPVAVDRCNVHRAERGAWVSCAKTYGARCDCLHLDTSTDLCKERAVARRNHPTLKPTKAAGVIDGFESRLEHITPAEGFERVWTVSDPDAVGGYVRMVLDRADGRTHVATGAAADLVTPD